MAFHQVNMDMFCLLPMEKSSRLSRRSCRCKTLKFTFSHTVEGLKS